MTSMIIIRLLISGPSPEEDALTDIFRLLACRINSGSLLELVE